MSKSEQRLAHELLSEFLERRNPALKPTLDEDFEHIYRATRIRIERGSSRGGRAQGIPFDIADLPLLAVYCFVTVQLLRSFFHHEAAPQVAAEQLRSFVPTRVLKDMQACSQEILSRLRALEASGELAPPLPPTPPEPGQPADLTLRIRKGGAPHEGLRFDVSSPSGRAPISYSSFQGRPLRRRPEEYHRWLVDELEALAARRRGPSGLGDRLSELGRSLYEELIPERLHAAYRDWARYVGTLVIISDEPWIPWEALKANDSEGYDADFLCSRHAVTRWLADSREPRGRIGLRRLACIVEEGSGRKRLAHASQERSFFREWAREESLQLDELSHPSYSQVKALFAKDDLSVLHFAGHAQTEKGLAEESTFFLSDHPLKPSQLHAADLPGIRRARPLVFFNACEAGQQSWTLTKLGGWARRWIRHGQCGGFIGPSWKVPDRPASLFATTFYGKLRQGRTVGEAASIAREKIRTRDDPTWLAYVLYAHPNAKLVRGHEPQPE